MQKWTFRAIGSRALLGILLIVSVAAVVSLVRAWRAERAAQLSCSLQFEPVPPLRYVEIQLKQQHPIEPTFSGFLFAVVQDSGIKNAVQLKVTRSGDRSYAPEVDVLPMAVSEDFGGLAATKQVDFNLVTITGAHRDFPFDSGVFDFTLNIEPHLPFGMVRIVNRVPGFVTECAEAKAERRADSSLHIRFTLRRSPLLQITAIVLAVGFLVFLCFIVTLHDVKALATATASFFFSVWSIRNVLGSEIHVFPTLLDCFVLIVCIVLVIALSWKAALSKPAEMLK